RSPQNHNREHSEQFPSFFSLDGPEKVRISDILPYDGAPLSRYLRAVDALSASLTRHNAAVIELGSDEAALFRCALESARLFFLSGKCDRGFYTYRAGRQQEDLDSSPPCMADIYKCMGKAARAALCAIARNLRLRSDVFNHLIDDAPLPADETSSSVLIAKFTPTALMPSMGGASALSKPISSCEVEKGLLMLVSADSPGIQVSDPNGRWYQADSCLEPGELLLLTGRSLTHVTAGLRPAASFRATPDSLLVPSRGGRTSLVFRLVPQGNAVMDCNSIAAAGHIIPQSYVPIPVNQFMDPISPVSDELFNQADNPCVMADNANGETSLRSVLSDPQSGAFLEDAVQVSCGHSFGGHLLQKVVTTAKCAFCNSEIDAGSLIPNHALRAAALAVKLEDDRRLFHNAALRKRRKQASEHNRENNEASLENEANRVAQYPFSENEKVIIK
ncbi:hypothetical protein M569_15703, partial [Genlisea aurea]